MASRRTSKKSTNAEDCPRLEPKWLTIEKVVAILETVLTPTARVQHNVFLPVLGRPEREPRQCDIVITDGSSYRQTITIVEVQDRTSKPSITMFHGWVQKMQEVGAQHLICVSALGYPKSIIDDVANRYGPTIRLMTLQELEEAKLPGLVLPNYLLYKNPKFIFDAIGPEIRTEPMPSSGSLGFSSHDKVFGTNDNENFNLYELTSKILNRSLRQLFINQGIEEPNSYVVDITLGETEENIYLYVNSQKYKILKLPLKLRIETQIIAVPLSCLVYQQEFIDGALAWIASARGSIENQEFLAKIVFKQDENGILQVAAMEVEGAEEISLYLYENEAEWKNAIAQNFNS